MDSTNNVAAHPAHPAAAAAEPTSVPAVHIHPTVPAVKLAVGEDDEDDALVRRLLNDKQQQALEWLVGGGTITEAAELVGVSRRTVSRWVNHHHVFKCRYEDWQDQVLT